MSSKKSAEPIKSGLLLIDKPQGFTSHDVIAVSRRILNTKKIGHSGTLDPMATGLLILLVGREATRRQDEFLKTNKTYAASLKLGIETDTWDAQGDIISRQAIPEISPQTLTKAISDLSGCIRQPIPFYSAKRIGGCHMYDLARSGAEMERKYNEVTVSWEQVRFTASDEISFILHGSCGTYVRSLGYMLAEKLGTKGHLSSLRRLKIGPYSAEDAFDGNLLKQTTTDELYGHIVSL